MDLRRRLSTLIAVRVIASTLLLGSAILIQLHRPGSSPVDPLFVLIGVVYALSVLYLATLRFVDARPWLVDLQLAIDALLISAFIHLTGGIASNFSSLYVLPVIAASTIRVRRVALEVAVLSAVLYLGLVTVQYIDAMQYLPSSWQVAVPADLPTLRFAQYTIAINMCGFFAVALLSGSLAERLRSAGASLEDASHQIADLRAFNETVIESLLSGLVTIDADCRVLTFNRAASLITGVSRDQAVGQDVTSVLQLPPDLRERLESLGSAPSLRLETQYHTTDRRALEIGLTATTLSFHDGARGYLLTFQDVTNVRRLERHARMQQRLAAVGEMAAGIAHEIRNPLASMSGSIQVLRQDLPLTDEQAQLMDIVLRESERLNDTIRSFLAYARPQRFSMSRLDVGKVVRDTALLLGNGTEVNGNHAVDVDVPAEPVWYEADENQIRQIVWNLATNALRAMAAGGVLRLSASSRDHEGQREVVLAVEDQGCGIAPEDIELLFQPFHSSFDKGTGLGLAIVHRIVTDYGGTIQVASQIGIGTRFMVRLPLRSDSWDSSQALQAVQVSH